MYFAVRDRRWVMGVHFALAVVLTASCAVRLISTYDELTDTSLTSVQQKTDDFVAALEENHGKAAASFASAEKFYDEIDGDLRRLEFRVASIPKNSHSEKLVSDIRAVILGKSDCSANGTSLRDLHCLGENKATGPSVAALEIARRNINTTISAALKLELAKKQGTETDK